MALSDDLTKLAARAKEAETRTAAARDQARADLEREVSSARTSADAQAEKLRQVAEEGKDSISGSGKDLQRSWSEHVAKVREDLESRKAEHDVHKAQRRADDAEDYASFEIDLAYSAVVEAEYAALDAVLARMDAEQLSSQAGTTA
jgi:hypothetical protein